MQGNMNVEFVIQESSNKQPYRKCSYPVLTSRQSWYEYS